MRERRGLVRDTGPSAWHEAGGRYLKKRGLRGDFFRAAVGKMDELREKLYLQDGFCAERMLFRSSGNRISVGRPGRSFVDSGMDFMKNVKTSVGLR